MKSPDLLSALQRINPLDLNDSMTFPPAPPSAQTYVHKMTNDQITIKFDIHGPNRKNHLYCGDFSCYFIFKPKACTRVIWSHQCLSYMYTVYVHGI